MLWEEIRPVKELRWNLIISISQVAGWISEVPGSYHIHELLQTPTLCVYLLRCCQDLMLSYVIKL